MVARTKSRTGRPQRGGPTGPHFPQITSDERCEIGTRARLGHSTSQLADAFGRSESEIDRALADARVDRLFDEPIDYVDNDEFLQPDADELILGPEPEVQGRKGRLRAPSGLPSYLASLYEVPLLSREQEFYFFRKMNYLKFKAARLRETINRKRPRARDLDQLEALLDEAAQVKAHLVRTNLRLVISIAKRYARPTANFFEVVSDGNVSLMRAIDKFDYSRGFKLSTYATWAIKRNFARMIPAEFTQLDRFRTGHDELFQASRDDRTSQLAEETVNRKQNEVLMEILDRLQDRERDIIALRYGLAGEDEPLTLEQIGSRLGVSKERIRQLESRALGKLRAIAADEPLDVPGF